jgi:pimeloyl-ACP methyl ester carboxylesterase
MEHLTVPANGAAFHVARTGKGPPLLHGWPEFWLTWEPVMARLADRYTVFAPDLRGFGDSDKRVGPFGPDQHAADMLALLNALDLNQVGVVGHDVGGALMQPLARTAPQRIAGLFFFDFVWHRAAHGGARSAQQYLVPVLPSAGDGASAGRRDTRKLPDLYRILSQGVGTSQGCVRRRARSLHG